MHELSLVQSIVEACSARANGAWVRKVTLEVGALSCVMPEALRFCFAAVSDGTALQGAELEILVRPGRSRCRECGRELSLRSLLDNCSCGSGNLEPPSGGDQLRIQSMEIEEAV
ncbi:hydrogenase/urease maturation nickel metallochaperone HypA [Microbulbifer rhizosphaerae]|uniref:Hydrogenase maturation factor HypA n=1 Tax=Microbulbifer rhizosphaerae TaxID=1562603 RepID=A0A7W4WFU4_9GAMM|nr:hydrogenase nickel incorporation protein HypA/HybF [Microbulbifer rhizosphaerae]